MLRPSATKCLTNQIWKKERNQIPGESIHLSMLSDLARAEKLKTVMISIRLLQVCRTTAFLRADPWIFLYWEKGEFKGASRLHTAIGSQRCSYIPYLSAMHTTCTYPHKWKIIICYAMRAGRDAATRSSPTDSVVLTRLSWQTYLFYTFIQDIKMIYNGCTPRIKFAARSE